MDGQPITVDENEYNAAARAAGMDRATILKAQAAERRCYRALLVDIHLRSRLSALRFE